MIKKELKPKKTKGQIKVLKAMPYKKSMVYIRRIGIEIFEYLVVFKKQIYSSYWVITPDKGKKNLTKDEVNQAAALCFAGAIATIDMQLGEKLDKKTKKIVKTFEGSRKKVVN
tara:strand:- start:346 stop:684 length:339 start_codon:yes stop_codon:yes gene_type:complete